MHTILHNLLGWKVYGVPHLPGHRLEYRSCQNKQKEIQATVDYGRLLKGMIGPNKQKMTTLIKLCCRLKCECCHVKNKKKKKEKKLIVFVVLGKQFSSLRQVKRPLGKKSRRFSAKLATRTSMCHGCSLFTVNSQLSFSHNLVHFYKTNHPQNFEQAYRRRKQVSYFFLKTYFWLSQTYQISTASSLLLPQCVTTVGVTTARLSMPSLFFAYFQ